MSQPNGCEGCRDDCECCKTTAGWLVNTCSQLETVEVGRAVDRVFEEQTVDVHIKLNTD